MRGAGGYSSCGLRGISKVVGRVETHLRVFLAEGGRTCALILSFSYSSIHSARTRARLVVSNFVSLWTVAHQAPLSMGFFRKEYWSGLPFLPQGDLPDPGIELVSLVSPGLAGGFFAPEPPGKPQHVHVEHLFCTKRC